MALFCKSLNKEGAIFSMDSFVILKNAKNKENSHNNFSPHNNKKIIRNSS